MLHKAWKSPRNLFRKKGMDPVVLQWAMHEVLIHSNNQAAMQIINKGTTADGLIMAKLRDLCWLSAVYNFHISATYIKDVRNIVADAISRLHNPHHLSRFYAFLTESLPQVLVDNSPLSNHMLADSYRFVFSRCTGCPTRHAVDSGSP